MDQRMFEMDSSKYRVIDISFLVVPGADADRPFDISRSYLPDRSYKFDISNTHTHVGTHVECSSHFFDDGRAVDEYPLNAFYGRGVLLHIDLPDEQRVIMPEYIDGLIGARLKSGDIVVCRNAREDAAGKRFLMEDAATYFKEKKAKMLVIGPNVGMGGSIEHGRNIHDILIRETTLLEIVSNLEQITKPEFFVLALPILIKGLDSSWCRAIVVEER